MKRKVLYRTGKILSALGRWLAVPFDKMSSYGTSLWDSNCDCYICQRRQPVGKELNKGSDCG